MLETWEWILTSDKHHTHQAGKAAASADRAQARRDKDCHQAKSDTRTQRKVKPTHRVITHGAFRACDLCGKWVGANSKPDGKGAWAARCVAHPKYTTIRRQGHVPALASGQCKMHPWSCIIFGISEKHTQKVKCAGRRINFPHRPSLATWGPPANNRESSTGLNHPSEQGGEAKPRASGTYGREHKRPHPSSWLSGLFAKRTRTAG